MAAPSCHVSEVLPLVPQVGAGVHGLACCQLAEACLPEEAACCHVGAFQRVELLQVVGEAFHQVHAAASVDDLLTQTHITYMLLKYGQLKMNTKLDITIPCYTIPVL